MLQDRFKPLRKYRNGLGTHLKRYRRPTRELGAVLEFFFTILGWFSTLVVVALLFLLLIYCATV